MDTKLQKKFFDYLAEHKLSQARVAREINYSSSVLSQYRKGNYAGDIEKLEETIATWLERQNRKQQIRKTNFVETNTFKRIYAAISTAHEEKTMGFIVGPAGIGKTYTIERYAQENANVLILQGESGLTENGTIRKIARALNIKETTSIISIKENIADQLRGADAILIVDEANYLKPNILDTIRRIIYDQAGCPVVFVGVKNLMSNIFLNPRDYHQLQRRIGVFLDLTGHSLDLTETKQITRTIFKEEEIEDRHIVKIKDITGGNIGLLSLLLERCARTCSLNNTTLDEDIIEACRKTIFLTAKK